MLTTCSVPWDSKMATLEPFSDFFFLISCLSESRSTLRFCAGGVNGSARPQSLEAINYWQRWCPAAAAGLCWLMRRTQDVHGAPRLQQLCKKKNKQDAFRVRPRIRSIWWSCVEPGRPKRKLTCGPIFNKRSWMNVTFSGIFLCCFLVCFLKGKVWFLEILKTKRHHQVVPFEMEVVHSLSCLRPKPGYLVTVCTYANKNFSVSWKWLLL